ncbi:MAG: Zn-ribbon domain-containing OB-fold protein [Chloroflexi bacterium]|nr:Zn-ribbon domain-containing OB-fold protein [Chloroflexota bacterium]
MEAFTSAAYNQYLGERELMGTRCRVDGRVYLPPRAICREGHDEIEWIELAGQGTLAAFTVVYVALSAMIAEGFNRQNPYCVGIVRLAEGPAISAQILGVDIKHPEQIQIGMPLKAIYVERGEAAARRTFLAFEPV